MSQEQGLYYPGGKFRSQSEIAMKLAYKDPEMVTPIIQGEVFGYWSDRFAKRADEMKAHKERTQHAEIRLADRSIISFIGDIHAGALDTDYRRVEQEVDQIVKTPHSYAVLMGDAIDGFFFNPAQMEEVEQVPEQIEYYNSLLTHLGSHHKLLAGWAGDHDEWSAKMGHSANARFARETGAYFMKGVGYLTLDVAGQKYNVTGTHRPAGHSIYNNAHGAMRLGRDAQGSDIVVTAHTHSKGVSQQPVKEYGGNSRLVTYISVGPYKSTDEYSQKLGFPDNSPQAMFGASVILEKDSKVVTPHYDIMEAHKAFGR